MNPKRRKKIIELSLKEKAAEVPQTLPQENVVVENKVEEIVEETAVATSKKRTKKVVDSE